MGDLMPFLGDGLLTIDGEFHRKSRMAMLPMFHRERIAAAQRVMVEEVDAALDSWQDGRRLDLYAWTRDLALRIAMRALFGIDPDTHRGRIDAAHEFETALGFWSKDYIFQIMRGPGLALEPHAGGAPAPGRHRLRRDPAPSPHGRARRGPALAAARRPGRRGPAPARQGRPRRGHDPDVRGPRHHDLDRSRSCSTSWPATRTWPSRADFDLQLAIDETLRMYPPAWIGPRRSLAPFEFAGVTVPGHVPVEYSSWASHHLPDVWDDAAGVPPAALEPRATATSCPRAPTSRSAAARAPASACASARPRSR